MERSGIGYYLQNMLNITVVAAWRSHCATIYTKLSHLEFLGHITMTLIQNESPGRARVQWEPRTLHMNHVTRVEPCSRNNFTRPMQCVQEEHENVGHKMPHQIILRTWRDMFSHFSKCRIISL